MPAGREVYESRQLVGNLSANDNVWLVLIVVELREIITIFCQLSTILSTEW